MTTTTIFDIVRIHGAPSLTTVTRPDWTGGGLVLRIVDPLRRSSIDPGVSEHDLRTDRAQGREGSQWSCDMAERVAAATHIALGRRAQGVSLLLAEAVAASIRPSLVEGTEVQLASAWGVGHHVIRHSVVATIDPYALGVTADRDAPLREVTVATVGVSILDDGDVEVSLDILGASPVSRRLSQDGPDSTLLRETMVSVAAALSSSITAADLTA